jgi:hypothetical protein
MGDWRIMETNSLGAEGCDGTAGSEASQGLSHDSFTARTSRQSRASETRTGRRMTAASSKSGSVRVAGHPWIRPTVAIISLSSGQCTVFIV